MNWCMQKPSLKSIILKWKLRSSKKFVLISTQFQTVVNLNVWNHWKHNFNFPLLLNIPAFEDCAYDPTHRHSSADASIATSTPASLWLLMGFLSTFQTPNTCKSLKHNVITIRQPEHKNSLMQILLLTYSTSYSSTIPYIHRLNMEQCIN